CFVQLPIRFGCLTVSSIGGNGVFRIYREKRFRVFRAPSSLAIVIKRGHSKYPSYAFHLWSLGDSNP
ncbi:hypothetical protein ABLN67_09975, partial [Mycobacterium tuberculosis]